MWEERFFESEGKCPIPTFLVEQKTQTRCFFHSVSTYRFNLAVSKCILGVCVCVCVCVSERERERARERERERPKDTTALPSSSS